MSQKPDPTKIKISVIKVSLLARPGAFKQTQTNQPKQAPFTKAGHSVPVPRQVVWPPEVLNKGLWRTGDLQLIHSLGRYRNQLLATADQGVYNDQQ